MPVRKRVGKRLRADKSGSARVIALALDMEEPLNEAIDAVHALRFIGYGLTHHGGEDEGRAVAALAWMACRRLDALQEVWRRLWEAAGMRKQL
jgi:hypothetical protein